MDDTLEAVFWPSFVVGKIVGSVADEVGEESVVEQFAVQIVVVPVDEAIQVVEFDVVALEAEVSNVLLLQTLYFEV